MRLWRCLLSGLNSIKMTQTQEDNMTVLNYVVKENIRDIVFHMFRQDYHSARIAINHLDNLLDTSTVIENEVGYRVCLRAEEED